MNKVIYYQKIIYLDCQFQLQHAKSLVVITPILTIGKT
jgi:hypothetical protein